MIRICVAGFQITQPIPESMDAWCRQGPAHHIALGIGDHAGAIEAFGEAMNFEVVRI